MSSQNSTSFKTLFLYLCSSTLPCCRHNSVLPQSVLAVILVILLPVVLSVENAAKVILDTGLEFDMLKLQDGRFRFTISDEEGALVEQHAGTREEKIFTFINYVLNLDPTPSWRRILSAIDQVGNNEAIAAKLYEYAEPITGNF